MSTEESAAQHEYQKILRLLWAKPDKAEYNECPKCGTQWTPPELVCPKCQDDATARDGKGAT